MKTLTIRTHALILGTRQTRCSCNLCSWEPFKSFENSGEGIVERFWDRVDTKGRDVNSIEGWTNGEEVYPIGPPRTLFYLKHHPKNLLSVEAERAGRRSEQMNPRMLDCQRMSVLLQDGLRMV